MRQFVGLLIVITLLAGGIAATGFSKTISSDVLLPRTVGKNGVRGKKFLRTGDAGNEDTNKGDRRLVNIDLVLQDAAKTVKEATKWKAQFTWWIFIANKSPDKLGQEWGLSHLGPLMRSHAKWKKLMAYHTFYGKGPLPYK